VRTWIMEAVCDRTKELTSLSYLASVKPHAASSNVP
jgi:hypothetical protein